MARLGCLRPANGLLVHAGAMVVSGKALLFLGHSGAGKSTICRLLGEHYSTLSDDLLRLTRRQDGAWFVDDLWHQQNQVPLYGLVRIFQSKSTLLTLASSRETCHYLIDAVFEAVIDEQPSAASIRTWFAYGGEISKKYSGWKLQFPLSSAVTQLIRVAFDSPTQIDVTKS